MRVDALNGCAPAPASVFRGTCPPCMVWAGTVLICEQSRGLSDAWNQLGTDRPATATGGGQPAAGHNPRLSVDRQPPSADRKPPGQSVVCRGGWQAQRLPPGPLPRPPHASATPDLSTSNQRRLGHAPTVPKKISLRCGMPRTVAAGVGHTSRITWAPKPRALLGAERAPVLKTHQKQRQRSRAAGDARCRARDARRVGPSLSTIDRRWMTSPWYIMVTTVPAAGAVVPSLLQAALSPPRPAVLLHGPLSSAAARHSSRGGQSGTNSQSEKKIAGVLQPLGWR